MTPIALKIKRITESVISLPTLPTVVSKMIQLVDNPKTSASSLARLIYTDQALTARILKLANSAYYGFPREISTVNMAIVVLGFNTVKEMGLSLSVFEAFKGGNDGIFDISRFWQHSIGCGSAARIIARRFRDEAAGEAFVTGLLHDIGKVILKQYMRAEFAEIIQTATLGVEQLDDIELRIAGATHAQIGSWLTEKWNLPRLITDAVGFHHSPWEAKNDPVMVAMVTVADYLCHLCRIGNSGRVNPVKPDERTWNIFRDASVPVEEADLAQLQTEFLLEFDKTESVLSFMTEETEG